MRYILLLVYTAYSGDWVSLLDDSHGLAFTYVEAAGVGYKFWWMDMA